MSNITKNFLEIQNDFGFNVVDAVREKMRILEDNLPSEDNEEQD